MLPWVVFPSLILLWADVVVSQTRVTGVVGQTVMLPCSYFAAHEIAPMCWGRGSCPLYKCSNVVARTDGYRVTFTKDKRYKMNGIISRGNLSLTIENAVLSDTGIYCCRIEFNGWFNDYKKNIFLEVKPAPSKVTSVPTPPKVTSVPTPPKVTSVPTPPKVTSVPTPPKVTSVPTSPKVTSVPTPPKVTSVPTLPKVTSVPTSPKVTSVPTPPKFTSVPTPPKVSTFAPTTPAPTRNLQTETTSSSAAQKTGTQPLTSQETSTTSSLLNSSCPTDGNSNVTQPSDCGGQYNKTQKTQRNTSKLYIGLGIAAMILLIILAAILTKKYLCGKRKVLHISKDPVTGTSQNETSVRYQPHGNLCFENNLYNVQ
uniref:Ig-like domain-containing protein n=1 Tax=Pipistrellus kuhlii TaxID=59472 RepID=A0A7J7XAC7_PIPKU|nr:hypothetical protein mPipKuh1_006073 [Pipistrellus kuhlii]